MASPSSIQGHCDPQFQALRSLLDEDLKSGEELGLSISVTLGEEKVVDLWGGFSDPERSKPWTEDTIAAVWSISKLITNIAALILIDRGQLDPSAPVSTYWPEFAANGKENILVKHILSHTSGVSSWEAPITLEEILDARRGAARLAAQAPWWSPPGVSPGYHLTNQGHMIGEIVQRITGKSLGTFIRDEIADPLDADYQLGLSSESNWDRVADNIPPPDFPMPDGIDPNSVFMKTVSLPVTAETSGTPEFRKAELGAVGGFSNARAVARIGSLIANGGHLDGKRLLSEEAIEKLLEEQVDGIDQVLGMRVRYGLGCGLPTPEAAPWLPSDGKIAFWGGWGGSLLIMDVGRNMSIGFVMNKMRQVFLGYPASQEYVKLIYSIVDKMQGSA